MASMYTDKSEYAFSSWTFENVNLHEALIQIADHGFTSVELWGDTVHFDPRAEIDRAAIAKWVAETGLSVHSVHGPFRNFGRYSDKEQFTAYRQSLWRKTIDDCSDLGVPIMVVHGLDRNEYNYSNDEVEKVRDSLADLVDYGRPRGVMIALENIAGGTGTHDEIRCRLEDHVRNYAGIGLKYCLDIGHTLLNGADLYREIDAVGKDLVTLHIHNNDGMQDSHELPDQGVIDWPAVYAYLRDGRYDGEFVMEVYGGDDPRVVLEAVSALFD
jgi:sugar phosphate isomerase/epimerase